MKLFRLPDLGEGLVEAEIVSWHVGEGDHVIADQPLVSVETAKAVVEIPSPASGTIARLHGQVGDIVHTGDALIEFTQAERSDAGTVVGKVEAAPATAGRRSAPEPGTKLPGGVRAAPAVRALARGRGIDLAVITPTGPDASITTADVERAARTLDAHGPIEPLRGVRRAMARNMALAHAEVAPVTLCEDADIHAWAPEDDVTLRLVRAIAHACAAEPALNAWYDSHAVGRRLLERIDLAIAVDTPEGLFVPVLRDIGGREREDLRAALERIKADVRARSIPPEEMRGYSFTLSNFGTIAGRYASPIILPPTVAILGAGVIREAVVAAGGRPAVHRVLPISLTFDHRAVTGGEAGRFLAAAIADLERDA